MPKLASGQLQGFAPYLSMCWHRTTDHCCMQLFVGSHWPIDRNPLRGRWRGTLRRLCSVHTRKMSSPLSWIILIAGTLLRKGVVVGADSAVIGFARDASRGADGFAEPLGHCPAVLWRPGTRRLTVLRADDRHEQVRRIAGMPVAASFGIIEALSPTLTCRWFTRGSSADRRPAVVASAALLSAPVIAVPTLEMLLGARGIQMAAVWHLVTWATGSARHHYVTL